MPIQEVIEHLNNNNTPGLLIFVYFEKAFVSFDHFFIFKSLKHFNFGNNLISYVKLFYTDTKGVIINNRHLFEYFSIERVVRQGCRLSLFVQFYCKMYGGN